MQDSRTLGSARIELGCSTEFVRHIDGSFEFALEAVRHMGVGNVEVVASCAYCGFASQRFCSVLSLFNEPLEIRSRLSSQGLKVSQLECYAPLVGPEAAEFGMSTLLYALDFAAEVGAPYVSTVGCWNLPYRMSEVELLAQLRQNLRYALTAAAEHGVGINIQTRGPLGERLAGALRLMELGDDEGRRWLGLSFDPGDVYLAGEDPVAFLRGALPWIRHVHVTDVAGPLGTGDPPVDGTYTGAVPLGDGVLAGPIQECLQLLMEEGWQGVASLQADGLDEARRSVERLRRMLRDRPE